MIVYRFWCASGVNSPPLTQEQGINGRVLRVQTAAPWMLSAADGWSWSHSGRDELFAASRLSQVWLGHPVVTPAIKPRQFST
ncbi:MAG: hypothetical protein B7Z55_18890, partial [Planctomycetales bacterium 12-60-4]